MGEVLLGAVENVSHCRQTHITRSMDKARLTSAYQMNNLVSISRLYGGFYPLRSRENLPDAFDRHSIGRQAQVGKQSGNAKPFGHFASFSIYNNLDSWIHCDTGAGGFSRTFDFSRNRNSP